MRLSISKFSVIMLALPILASASVLPRTGSTGASCGSTTSGQAQCCNSTQSNTTPLPFPLSVIVGLLGIDLGAITGLVGLTCNPITVLGLGGTNCNSQAVCCTGNTFNGLINLGCSPLNVAL